MHAVTKHILNDSVTPAEGEVSVKTYHCTYYRSRLLGLTASGYIEVTNKRVLFEARGRSVTGVSIIHTEVSVADVTGIDSYIGVYFRLVDLAIAFVVSFIASWLVFAIIRGIILSIDVEWIVTLLGWIVALISFGRSFFVSSKSVWRSVLVSVSASALWAIEGPIFLVILIAIYALVCFFWYARRHSFSLSIHTKGGSDTPIHISGPAFSVDIAARALTAEPAEEAEKLLKELGAVILDVQTLGDLAIKKWKSA